VLAVLLAITAIAAAPGPTNLGKALEAQRRLATEKPQDPAVFNDLGNLLMLASRPADAEAAYRKAVELDPKKVSALFNLGLLLQQRGERQEALRLYEQVVEIDPRHAWAHYQIGSLREIAGQEAKAIDAYAEAFSLDPQLAFSDVNPHIVENHLVTQAMLRAYRSEQAAPQAPKLYDDPTRIAALLVPPPEAKPQETQQEAQQEAAAQTPTGQAAQTRPVQPGATGQPGQANAYRQPSRPMGQVQQPGSVGNRPGQAMPGYAVPSPGVPPRSLRQWNRPEPQTEGYPNEEAPGQVITPPPGGVYYQPGLPSTGRLDIRLLPETERRASRG
jgi:tetratricopeptide (TPR) repeat protein